MTEKSEVVVRVKDLHKSYGEVHALKGLDLDVSAGQILGFLGPNGAGKTTAIKILSGFIAADSGTASICGFDCHSESIQVRRHLGYLPENNPIYPEMRVVDALKFVGAAHRLKGRALQDALARVVEQTQLQDVYMRQVATCSKGFRQRVGLAQALLNDPEVLLLDEPTNGLDPLQVHEMRNLILQLGSEKTVIITSHVLSEIEAVASRVVMMNNGRKVADKNIAELDAEQLVAVRLHCNEIQFDEICKRANARVEQFVANNSSADLTEALVRDADNSRGLVQRIAKSAQQANVDVAMLNPQGNSLEFEFRNICQQRGEL
ncbi:MAG: ATP-binding cassette domain-containing protein [Planctomycetes bacterium]|nr:ATP-binding cassette domain-containing protein [Planctomycetota bacterium]